MSVVRSAWRVAHGARASSLGALHLHLFWNAAQAARCPHEKERASQPGECTRGWARARARSADAAHRPGGHAPRGRAPRAAARARRAAARETGRRLPRVDEARA
ncbi:hypothetical protein AMAG_20249 [Allomyces macrogynus ATCC 38327]|uniref:Uncharacterized protein n=1 Tax=Allomyces macrogynus (strain ATCC 38327) TaxID=578462 RepID=A0A0L0T5Z0_ALLM3|nr:hypothetical protein AMAG_20249 [Allomyces macrogynus ATCC 38327]|eukprot:KNE70170.1 hypothetical protein AMAG_20249 [Allomyces macrogynus ATCC 38327]